MGPDKIVFHTLACYPDTSISELGAIICKDCLENAVVCQEDLKEMSLLQRKSRLPDKLFSIGLVAWFFEISSRLIKWVFPYLATTNGRNHLLTLTARCLSDQSLLHL